MSQEGAVREYMRMLDGVAERSERIGDRVIASHWPFVGTDYRGLLIVGQALAGWDDETSPALWRPSALDAADGRRAVLEATQTWARDRPEPITEPLRTRGGKPFWSGRSWTTLIQVGSSSSQARATGIQWGGPSDFAVSADSTGRC